MRPRQPLKPDLTMYKLARCWAKESGESGLVGHNRVQCEKGFMAECCSYGKSTALGIVLQLLIDHGVPSLGHRKICLSDKYSLVGATISTHLTYRFTSVLDFSYSNVRTYSPRRDINTRTWSNNSDVRLKPYNWCFKFGYQMFSNPISTELFKSNSVQGVFNETSRSMFSNYTFGIYKKFGIKERPRRSIRERYVKAGIKYRDRSWSDLIGLKYEFIAAAPLSFSQNTQERLSFNSRLSLDMMLAKFLNFGVGAAFFADLKALPQALFSPSVGMTFPLWRFNLTSHFHYFTNFNQVSLWNFSGGVLYNINFGRSAWN